MLGAFVNLFRSIPFLILMVALIPFTRLIVGTTYGVWAAVVPRYRRYTVLCADRRSESARGRLRPDRSRTGHGLPALAHHLARAVARSLPGIVGGFTITLVTMINSSAMARVIGAGGLGILPTATATSVSIRRSCSR